MDLGPRAPPHQREATEVLLSRTLQAFMDEDEESPANEPGESRVYDMHVGPRGATAHASPAPILTRSWHVLAAGEQLAANASALDASLVQLRQKRREQLQQGGSSSAATASSSTSCSPLPARAGPATTPTSSATPPLGQMLRELAQLEEACPGSASGAVHELLARLADRRAAAGTRADCAAPHASAATEPARRAAPPDSAEVVPPEGRHTRTAIDDDDAAGACSPATAASSHHHDCKSPNHRDLPKSPHHREPPSLDLCRSAED